MDGSARTPGPGTTGLRRVMVVGGPGSGKSTVARRLGALTGLPVYHMDHLHWLPGWEERPRTEKVALAREIEAREAWIFEGGLSSTYANRAARADLVVWLDLGLGRRLWRVVRRTASSWGQVRPDMTEGCPERFDPAFFRWIVTASRTTRDRIERVCTGLPEDRLCRLTDQRQIDRWLASLADPERRA